MKQINKTQLLGCIILGISLFTYLGGIQLIYGFYPLSFTGMKLKITVKDKQTNQPIKDAVVTITGIDWQDTGTHVPLNVELSPTDNNGECGTSISTWGTAYLRIQSDGYDTATATMSADSTETVTKTIKLTPQALPDEPEDPPPEEPDDSPDETPHENKDPTPIDVSKNLTETLQNYSIYTGLIGIGLITLGAKEEN